MATTTGTATDYQDLLADLKTFANSNGWTTERTTLSTEDELILRGDGDATDEIFVGIKTYSDAGPGYYNWECRGFTAYESANTFEDQPGKCNPVYVPLQNTTMNYWFWVTGRRICVIVKTVNAYQFMYLGFIDPYATDTEWPYPLLIMGSTHEVTRVYNSNAIEYASSVNPGGASNSPPAYIRWIDGGWYDVMNFVKSSSVESHSITTRVGVWPMCDGDTGTNDPEDANWRASSEGFRSRFCSTAQGGTAPALWFRTENNGGTAVVPLIPTVMVMSDSNEQLLGEIHNLYWCTLTNNVSAEDVVTDGVSLDEFIVFQNIHRTDPWCGLAIKDE